MIMDLLEQYKQQNPQAFREQKSQIANDPYGREYSTFITLVMRLSGGRIADARQASWVLLGIALCFGTLAFFLFYGTGGSGSVDTESFKNTTRGQGALPQ